MGNVSLEELGGLIEAEGREQELLEGLEQGLRELQTLLDAVEKALRKLPYNDFAVLQARYVDGHSREDLLRRFPLSDEDDLEEKLRSALDQLRSTLEKREELSIDAERARLALRAVGQRAELRARERAAKQKTLEVDVDSSDQELGDEPHRRLRRGLKAFIISLAAQQEMRCYRQPARRTRGGGSSASEARSSAELDEAVRALLKGEEEEVLESEDSEGLSFRLGYEAGDEDSYLVFSDLRARGDDGNVESFRVRFRAEDKDTVFESEDGEARVPIGAFTDLLGRDYSIIIER